MWNPIDYPLMPKGKRKLLFSIPIHYIGKHLRLPDWKSCTFLVEDVGTKFLFGKICDENKEAIVHEVRLIDEPWEEVSGK